MADIVSYSDVVEMAGYVLGNTTGSQFLEMVWVSNQVGLLGHAVEYTSLFNEIRRCI